ncbi:VOC family protein [Paenibacillus crassostreae]|uniref:Glyoxalase n=1 Tax=Paenibacillus crassostreae TaxID=1763538 RepID=A0A167DVP9_9BACL|nr:VOC family protein [Paenibacillus crassostreae]AOZ91006.1 glyoxalase [Paenibacillus crassostreae]OAB74832.1 glyoxalase [Paenibacillus crassostreae]
MTSPIKNLINGVFIPVSNIESARDWYCNLLNLPNDGEIFFGHIYVLSMQGKTNIVLDSQIYSPDNVFKIPSVQLATDDIEKSYEYIKSMNIELITEIENGHWFNIKDPDGNILMICK